MSADRALSAKRERLRVKDAAKVLFRHAQLKSIANVESTIQIYDILLASYHKQLGTRAWDKKLTEFDIVQTKAYRSLMDSRRKKLLEEAKHMPVNGRLVNKMLEVIVMGSKAQVLDAIEYYWHTIQEAHVRLATGQERDEDTVANLKALHDCRRILHKQYLILTSR